MCVDMLIFIFLLAELLETFANILDPDQARLNVGSDLDPNYLTLWWYSWKLKKSTDKKGENEKLRKKFQLACKE